MHHIVHLKQHERSNLLAHFPLHLKPYTPLQSLLFLFNFVFHLLLVVGLQLWLCVYDKDWVANEVLDDIDNDQVKVGAIYEYPLTM